MKAVDHLMGKDARQLVPVAVQRGEKSVVDADVVGGGAGRVEGFVRVHAPADRSPKPYRRDRPVRGCGAVRSGRGSPLPAWFSLRPREQAGPRKRALPIPSCLFLVNNLFFLLYHSREKKQNEK